jgi:hypothetical protein
MTTPRATIAILSIGQMGLGIAQLLAAHSYCIITNASDRSAATQDRARSAGIELYDTDKELVAQADYIFSIVPPRDATATAKRIEVALGKAERRKEKGELWYIDLNATSPSTVKSINTSFEKNAQNVRFLDGGIIGHPPVPTSETDPSGWTRPDIPLSGPFPLHQRDAYLAQVLNTRYLGEEIGSASGLKCCFAALTKGFTALALQSFTTASSLGVLEPLQDYMDMYNPNVRQKAERGIVGCTGKAYRWVEEMNQIGECFAGEGNWQEQAQVFRQIAGVFEGLAGVVEKQGKDGGNMKDAESVVTTLSTELKGKKEKQES